METRVVDVQTATGLAEGLAQACDVLRRGGLVAFPTETVYGLGANALQGRFVRKIFRAKGRPPTNPLIVHVASIDQARNMSSDWSELAQRLAEHYWPGPLTLVVPRHCRVPDQVTAGGPTVAVRIPGHPVALALLRAVELPLAAPSANCSNFLSPTRAEHVYGDLKGRIDLILDAGPTPGGIESTVIDVTSAPPRLLRPGIITKADLESVVGAVAVGPSPQSTIASSPGLSERHYCPRTPLELTHDPEQREAELLAKGLRVVIVSHRLTRPEVVRLPADAEGYARELYARLREADLRGLDRILLELPPEGDRWYAVHDRLRRAATW